jgi:hypothetical protein
MVNQITPNNQLTSNLSQTVKELSANLQAIQPSNNRTAQLITYALVATAITGIMVYHYIRNQEEAF